MRLDLDQQKLDRVDRSFWSMYDAWVYIFVFDAGKQYQIFIDSYCGRQSNR